MMWLANQYGFKLSNHRERKTPREEKNQVVPLRCFFCLGARVGGVWWLFQKQTPPLPTSPPPPWELLRAVWTKRQGMGCFWTIRFPNSLHCLWASFVPALVAPSHHHRSHVHLGQGNMLRDSLWGIGCVLTERELPRTHLESSCPLHVKDKAPRAMSENLEEDLVEMTAPNLRKCSVVSEHYRAKPPPIGLEIGILQPETFPPMLPQFPSQTSWSCFLCQKPQS